jgi:hypothetical protein
MHAALVSRILRDHTLWEEIFDDTPEETAVEPRPHVTRPLA